MIHVYDACALIAFLRNEPGAFVVAEALLEDDSQQVIHAVNLCEIYYDMIRVSGIPSADTAMTQVAALRVEPRADLDDEFWKAAGRLKVAGGLSLADCFAVALTARTGGTLLTADHREFDPIASQGLCTIRFIR